jgi:hypothetical protein
MQKNNKSDTEYRRLHVLHQHINPEDAKSHAAKIPRQIAMQVQSNTSIRFNLMTHCSIQMQLM